jgi:hypothetical protein
LLRLLEEAVIYVPTDDDLVGRIHEAIGTVQDSKSD